MARPQKAYTPLTRSRGRGLFGTHTLWLGRDHVLLVVNYGFWEDYRRFYFRDIRQVSVVKTAWATAASAVLAATLVSALALLSGAVRTLEPAALWPSAWAAVTSLVLLSLNLWRGASCRCLLHTAVQTVELKPLGRLRAAVAALARLRPLIEAAQGGPAPPGAIGATPTAPQALVAAARRSPTAWRAQSYGGGAHVAAFALLLLGALAGFARFYEPRVAIYLAHGLIATGTLVAVVTALVKQRGSRMGPGLRGVTWAVVGLMLVFIFAGELENVIIGIRNPDLADDFWKRIEHLALDKAPWRRAVLLVSGVWSAAMGLAGTLLLLGFWKSSRLQPAAPAAPGGNPGPL